MEWILIGVLIFAGTGSDVIPITKTIDSRTYPTIEMCEGEIIRMRFGEDDSAKKIKTDSVFVDGEYEQIIVSSPINLTGYGKGIIHYSCIPIPE